MSDWADKVEMQIWERARKYFPSNLIADALRRARQDALEEGRAEVERLTAENERLREALREIYLLSKDERIMRKSKAALGTKE